jgi:hypothetical protein
MRVFVSCHLLKQGYNVLEINVFWSNCIIWSEAPPPPLEKKCVQVILLAIYDLREKTCWRIKKQAELFVDNTVCVLQLELADIAKGGDVCEQKSTTKKNKERSSNTAAKGRRECSYTGYRL